eukprot:Trichotokara_eunicae@DN2381_c0_g1_i1.p1
MQQQQQVHQSGILVVLGAQWGDEGKGKLVEVLSREADAVCRFNGGSNAGHTIQLGGKKIALHLLPCGVIKPSVDNLIGNGCVVHLGKLMDEITSVEPSYPKVLHKLHTSERAHLV